MDIFLAILNGPITSGILPINLVLVVLLIFVKLFDAWSTAYVIGHGGSETMSLAGWLIKRLGLIWGVVADFAIVAATAWFTYPYWWLLAGVLAWYGYWMALQVGELKKTNST